MKKVLASIGIGNATVDTVLPSTTVTPGESVDAEVRIEGGDAEQAVDRIELELETATAPTTVTARGPSTASCSRRG